MFDNLEQNPWDCSALIWSSRALILSVLQKLWHLIHVHPPQGITSAEFEQNAILYDRATSWLIKHEWISFFRLSLNRNWVWYCCCRLSLKDTRELFLHAGKMEVKTCLFKLRVFSPDRPKNHFLLKWYHLTSSWIKCFWTFTWSCYSSFSLQLSCWLMFLIAYLVLLHSLNHTVVRLGLS